MLIPCGPHRPPCLVSDTHNPREAAGKGPEMYRLEREHNFN